MKKFLLNNKWNTVYIPRDFLFLYQYRILNKFKSILILNQFYTRYLCNVEKIVTCCHCLIRKRNDGGWWSVCIELIFPNINDVYIEVDWRTLSSLKSIPNTVDFSREEGFWIQFDVLFVAFCQRWVNRKIRIHMIIVSTILILFCVGQQLI